MRKIPLATIKKLKERVHSKYHRNQLGFNMTLSRVGVSPLADSHHFEHVDTLIGGVTDCDISVVHDTVHGMCGDVWFVTIEGGNAYVYYSKYKHDIRKHKVYKMLDLGPAIACSIGHDGKQIINDKYVETNVTNEKPLVFWITPTGSLICKDLNTNVETVLVTENCTDVDCINATRNIDDNFDYGFVVAYLVERKAYTTQLTDGVWSKPAVIEPLDGEYTSISLVRTWDYRIIVSCTDTSNNKHRLYSQFQGFAKHTFDKINLDASLKYTCRPSVPPTMVNAYNVEVDGNYGRIIVVEVDHELIPNSVNNEYFIITNGMYEYIPTSVNAIGNTIILKFNDFNMMFDTDITITYTTSSSYYDGCDHVYNNNYISMQKHSIKFTPVGLVDPRPPITPLDVSATYIYDVKFKTNTTLHSSDHLHIAATYDYIVRQTNHIDSGETVDNLSLSCSMTYEVIKTTDI